MVIDPDKGARSLAKVWERMPSDRLALVVATYQDPALARVLSRMDPKKAAGVLALLPPGRAARLSQQMEALASRVPTEEEM